MYFGFIDEPMQILYTDFAIYLGIVYSYLPFMVLPLYCGAGTTRSHAERSRVRPRCPTVARIRVDHAAAVAAGHHCRLRPGVHSRGGRVRDSPKCSADRTPQ
jgi:hypothetical protein